MARREGPLPIKALRHRFLALPGRLIRSGRRWRLLQRERRATPPVRNRPDGCEPIRAATDAYFHMATRSRARQLPAQACSIRGPEWYLIARTHRNALRQ